LFQSSDPDVPRGYEDVPFYFWFNTAFVDGDNPRLVLKRDQLDNPHKPKTWTVFREKFQVEVFFSK
jgi:PTEN phosphatase family protein